MPYAMLFCRLRNSYRVCGKGYNLGRRRRGNGENDRTGLTSGQWVPARRFHAKGSCEYILNPMFPRALGP